MQISDMIAGVDIIGGKVSVASVIGAGGYGDVLTQQQGVLGGWSTLRKICPNRTESLLIVN